MLIGIVILNFKTYHDTFKLVHELQKQTLARSLKIVVVDNASPNNSFEKLRPLQSQYGNVTVIRTKSNIGYARGNNFGLNYLEEYIKPKYVAILNNDIILNQDCFERLIKCYQKLDKPAFIAPKQLNINGEEVPPFQMNTFIDDLLDFFYVYRMIGKSKRLNYHDNTGKNAMKVDLISGSFMFISLSSFKEMGYFYPNTFLFTEERFIAHKSLDIGLNNYIILDDTYIHAHSKSINNFVNKIDKYKMLYDGRLEFTRKFRPAGELKGIIFKLLAKISLFELRIIILIQQLLRSLKKIFKK